MEGSKNMEYTVHGLHTGGSSDRLTCGMSEDPKDGVQLKAGVWLRRTGNSRLRHSVIVLYP